MESQVVKYAKEELLGNVNSIIHFKIDLQLLHNTEGCYQIQSTILTIYFLVFSKSLSWPIEDGQSVIKLEVNFKC